MQYNYESMLDLKMPNFTQAFRPLRCDRFELRYVTFVRLVVISQVLYLPNVIFNPKRWGLVSKTSTKTG